MRRGRPSRQSFALAGVFRRRFLMASCFNPGGDNLSGLRAPRWGRAGPGAVSEISCQNTAPLLPLFFLIRACARLMCCPASPAPPRLAPSRPVFHLRPLSSSTRVYSERLIISIFCINLLGVDTLCAERSSAAARPTAFINILRAFVTFPAADARATRRSADRGLRTARCLRYSQTESQCPNPPPPPAPQVRKLQTW